MSDRVRLLNNQPLRPGGQYVLYWMQANRRVEANHALLYAAELANEQDVPLVCYEELDCLGPQANDRCHTFVLEGVAERDRALRKLGIGYVFRLPGREDDVPGTFERLVSGAAGLVTDDHPTLARRPDLPLSCRAVDSSCVVPMSRIRKQEYAAYTIRPKIRRMLPECLALPKPVSVEQRLRDAFPSLHTRVAARGIKLLVASCGIDHSVPPSITYRGRRSDAEKLLDRFLDERLRRYARQRNEPSAHATSELSPYLHYGLISPLEVAVKARDHAREHRLAAEEFLEELIVRRELSFNFTRHASRPRSLESLPEWAHKTLRAHARDQRKPVYTPEQFEHAGTHDELWNAAQKEMLLRGRIHGYYRMYWGKKIIEWSATPESALEIMLRIHDCYALDGGDPNTYAGILWCFGLHDRPWPERPVFGNVRYMSLEGMQRKTDVAAYLKEIEDLERTGQDAFRIQ